LDEEREMTSAMGARFAEFLQSSKRDLNLSGGRPEDIFAAVKKIFDIYMEMDKKTSFMGIYILHKDILVLGPYVGPATIHDLIPISRGVVGKCAETAEHLLVGDVSSCSIYIECCPSVKAEVVVPVKTENHDLIAVLDLDSDQINAYDEEDRLCLDELAALLAPAGRKLAEGIHLRVEW
jgi:putative methionine-R-sulfoxide reductase with GAF domain